MTIKNDVLKTFPTVWAVGKEYQIIVSVTESVVMWVCVNGVNYYDHSNGILRSNKTVHRMIVPMDELDKAKEYTICFRRMYERKAYFSDSGEIETKTFEFCPYEGGDINIYHISDTHNRINGPVLAGGYFDEDKLNLFVLNGDIPDDCDDINNFNSIYEISGEITKGRIPAIFSKGNHDNRGIYAEVFSDYTPNNNGLTYYSVRLGDLWCLVLDAGEDKADERIEYGNTICFHAQRQEETRFLDNIIKNAQNEYNADGVKKRIIISHTPFTYCNEFPFDIEQDIYSSWVKKIGDYIKPDFYLCGHLHQCRIIKPGDKDDSHNQSCPTIIGSIRGEEINEFTGTAISYKEQKIIVSFTNEKKEVVSSKTLN